MQFGFSYVGLIYLVMLMLPNIIWTKNQPRDYEKYVRNENRFLLALERSGNVKIVEAMFNKQAADPDSLLSKYQCVFSGAKPDDVPVTGIFADEFRYPAELEEIKHINENAIIEELNGLGRGIKISKRTRY